MRHTEDPRQLLLFDAQEGILSKVARDRLDGGWAWLFRHVLLNLMPVEELGKHFHPRIGRPTKELYSMAGLILLSEFFDWTVERAADEYMFNMQLQYALNLPSYDLSMSVSSVERYRRLFREDELAYAVFEKVTAGLIEHSQIELDRQRLDSTHIFSNMALFGRTRLMVETIKRFLTQVSRHNKKAYGELHSDLVARYAKPASAIFGEYAKADPNRHVLCRQEVAQDMASLIARFEQDKSVCDRTTFKNLLRVFAEQCEVIEEKIELREKVSSRCMQNPSDPDATYDGHKGAGYQAQVCETCNPDNDAQIITGVEVQTAAESDSLVLQPFVKALDEADRKPEELLADGGYGSDANVRFCEANDVELVAPSPKGNTKEDRLSLNDFDFDETKQTVSKCPNGHEPIRCSYSAQTERGSGTFSQDACGHCADFPRCPVFGKGRRYRLKYSAKERRLSQRRAFEKTEIFRDRYRLRSGVEAMFSCLNRVTGIKRLRVRGMCAVTMSLILKITGENMRRVATSRRIMDGIRAKYPGRLHDDASIDRQAPVYRSVLAITVICISYRFDFSFSRCGN